MSECRVRPYVITFQSPSGFLLSMAGFSRSRSRDFLKTFFSSSIIIRAISFNNQSQITHQPLPKKKKLQHNRLTAQQRRTDGKPADICIAYLNIDI